MADIINLLIDQGSTWSFGVLCTVNGTVIDDSWTAACQIRKTVEANEVLHTFTPTVSPAGVVILTLTGAESSAWLWRTAVYDIEVSSGSVTARVAQGRVTVNPEVTR